MLITIEKRIMPTSDIIKRLGVDERGKVQRFATEQIRVRMKPYLPWRTGATATDLTYSDSPTSIIVAAPYARYLYHGFKMKDPMGGGPFPLKDSDGTPNGDFRYRKGAHPIPTGEKLSYTHTINPMAGPRWDRTMAQREGAKIAQAIEAYAKEVSR